MKRFAALVGLILAGALLPSRAQQNPDNQYIAIYSLIQQADALQASGQTREALDSYTQALDELKLLQKAFPDWDPKVVTFRLNYLSQKVSGLSAPVTADTPGGTLPSATSTPALDNTLPTTTNAPSAAPATDMEMQLSALNAQVQGLQAENELLQAKLKEALSAQPATVDALALVNAQGQVLSLMKDNDLLRASLSTGATNVAAKEAAPVESSKTPQALADANQKLAGQTRRADELAQENQVLQSAASVNALEKSALEKRLQQRQTPAASAPTESSDEVKSLRARLAADEAQAVPYTPEELALLNPSPPAPVAAAGNQEKTVNKLPDGSAPLVAEAQKYFIAGDYAKAEADYNQILQGDPGNALVLANLAAIDLQENKLDEAETNITAALAKNPDDAYTVSTFGFLKFRQQKYDEALDALSRAAQLDPQNPQIQNYLGVTFSQKGLPAQAETALRKAIDLAPDYGAAHNNLAVIYLSEKPPMAALARWHYQKAIELGQPRNPDLEKNLADAGVPVNPQ